MLTLVRLDRGMNSPFVHSECFFRSRGVIATLAFVIPDLFMYCHDMISQIPPLARGVITMLAFVVSDFIMDSFHI
jgi:hypothetical protein